MVEGETNSNGENTASSGGVRNAIVEQRSRPSLIWVIPIVAVLVGGTISNNKGVNLPDVVLPLAAMTEKDRDDLPFNIAWGAGTGLLIGGWFALINEGDNRETQQAIGVGVVPGSVCRVTKVALKRLPICIGGSGMPDGPGISAGWVPGGALGGTIWAAPGVGR